jgi:hypothetical protein
MTYTERKQEYLRVKRMSIEEIQHEMTKLLNPEYFGTKEEREQFAKSIVNTVRGKNND